MASEGGVYTRALKNGKLLCQQFPLSGGAVVIVKILKIGTPKIITVIVLKMKQKGFKLRSCTENVDRIANSVGPLGAV
ncbi:MAG: hypothetical protein AB2693_19215 [Candidatus Thiodiazotropha sp.]